MLHKTNKRAVSEIVGYVLLIVIAVGISISVYQFLKIQIPKETPECSPDISIVVQDYECNINEEYVLYLKLSNKGLFTIDGAYIRFGPEENKIKTLITKKNSPQDIKFEQGLLPGETEDKMYKLKALEDVILKGNMSVEIEPIQYINNNLVFCENSIITQPIKCVIS